MRLLNKKRKKAKKLGLYTYSTPNIVLVSEQNIFERLKDIEDNYHLAFRLCGLHELEMAIDSDTVAIMLDEHVLKRDEENALLKILRKCKITPVYYLARSERNSNFYRHLYEKGLKGVFHWSRDANQLHSLIIESLKPHPKAVGVTKGDKKLSNMIKAHLNVLGRYKKVRVKVIEGFTFLEGRVKSLFERNRIEKEAFEILGVKKVISDNLEVKKDSSLTDKEIKRKLNLFISRNFKREKKTISVKVKKRHVTILGVVSEPGSIVDLEIYAKKLPGVQSVERQVTYEPMKAKANIQKAKVIERKIKSLFRGVKFISIKIYGDSAEVSGKVKVKADRKLIEDYLLQVLPVKSVVNRIYT